ncbi:MAG: hypothetical protein PHR68_04130, partial [Candidatus Gracilibacteria bacterium]|nr:hypothetical protein [Candidatus Gracilibacteria bacterium]
EKYVNTNKLIFENLIIGKYQFEDENKDFLVKNEVINNNGYLTRISKFVLLNLLKLSEIQKDGDFYNQSIYNLLSLASIKKATIKKENKEYKAILYGFTLIYKNIKKEGKNSEYIKIFPIGDLSEAKNKFSFRLLKNYFKLSRYEKYIYRGIPISFINSENINKNKTDLMLYLHSLYIKKTENISVENLLKKFGGKTFTTNKSKAKKVLFEYIEIYKNIMSKGKRKVTLSSKSISFV